MDGEGPEPLPRGLNLYGYSVNDPINMVDASGRTPIPFPPITLPPWLVPVAEGAGAGGEEGATVGGPWGAVAGAALGALIACFTSDDAEAERKKCEESTGDDSDWANYCRGLPTPSLRARCWRHQSSTPTERKNWCNRVGNGLD